MCLAWLVNATIFPSHPSVRHLQVLVVKTFDCITRLKSGLAASGGGYVPSMLACTFIQSFK